MITVTARLTAPRKPAPAPKAVPPAPRTARMLALAHHVEDLVERGVLRDYADAARRLGLTRARVSQVMDLQLLAPRVQEGILLGEIRVAERGLRATVREVRWCDQQPGRRSGG